MFAVSITRRASVMWPTSPWQVSHFTSARVCAPWSKWIIAERGITFTLRQTDRLTALVELHQLDDLGMIGNAAAVAADAERHRRQPGARPLCRAVVAARAGHLAFDHVRLVTVGDRLRWWWGRLARAAGECEAREHRRGGEAGYPRPAMSIDRTALARLYAGEHGRAWDRIENERPSTYWEENVIGGRRLARRTIVHWLEPLTRQTVLDAGCGAGGLAAHLAGLGAKVVGIDLLPRFRSAPRVKGLRFAVADVREPAGSAGAFTTAILQEVLEDYPPEERVDLVRALAAWGAQADDSRHPRAEHLGRLGRPPVGQGRATAGGHRDALSRHPPRDAVLPHSARDRQTAQSRRRGRGIYPVA